MRSSSNSKTSTDVDIGVHGRLGGCRREISAAVYPVVTDTVPIVFDVEVPTVSQWGWVALGTSLLFAGLVLLRRRRA